MAHASVKGIDNFICQFNLQSLVLLARVILFFAILDVLVVILILLLCYLMRIKNYPKEERMDIVFTFGVCDKNCVLASRVYAQKFLTASLSL